MSGKQEEKMMQKMIAQTLETVQKKTDKQTMISPSKPTFLSLLFLWKVEICHAFDIKLNIGLTYRYRKTRIGYLNF